MTPAGLAEALAAGSLSLLVEDRGDEIFEALVATAREDCGWLYLSAQPMPARGGGVELSPQATATLVGGDGRRLSAAVGIGASSIPQGRALLAVIAVALQSDGDDARHSDVPPARGGAAIAPKETS